MKIPFLHKKRGENVKNKLINQLVFVIIFLPFYIKGKIRH